jgi:hypothetical protein
MTKNVKGKKTGQTTKIKNIKVVQQDEKKSFDAAARDETKTK